MLSLQFSTLFQFTLSLSLSLFQFTFGTLPSEFRDLLPDSVHSPETFFRVSCVTDSYRKFSEAYLVRTRQAVSVYMANRYPIGPVVIAIRKYKTKTKAPTD